MNKKFIFCFLWIVLLISLKSYAWMPEEKQDFRYTALLDTSYRKVLSIGKVISIEKQPISDPGSFVKRVDKLAIKLGKPLKGKVIKINNYITGNKTFDVVLNKGDRCIVWVELRRGKIDNAYIADYYRMPYLLILLLLLMGLFFVVTGMKGFRAFLALLINVFLIFGLMLPLILKGANVFLLGTIFVVLMTVITYFFIHGFELKTIPVILGTLLGVLSAFFIALLFRRWLVLTGLSDATARMLQFIKSDLDFGALLLLAIVIGALGAIMDIAMDISSALYELHDTKKGISRRELIRRGYNIGKAVLGTMINTLIFAYIGSALIFLLLYYASGFGNLLIINFQYIAQQYLQAVVGSIGLVVTVPATIYITILFLK